MKISLSHTCFSLLTLSLIILLTTTQSSQALASSNEEANLIDKTCKQTSYYDLCAKSLKSDPRSSSAQDVKGLAKITLDIVMVKANETLYHAGELFNNTRDGALYRKYGTCIMEFQRDVEDRIPGAITALDSSNYKSSSGNATDVATSAMVCQDQFVGEKSPLADQSNVVHDLSLVASSIISTLG